MVSIEKEVIEAYALDNALSYEGKANPNSVLNALFSEGLKKEEIKDIMPQITEIVKKVNSQTISEQELSFLALKERIHKRKVREEGELPELPNAKKGEVVMRLAPFPSGPLHIGNTRAAILNDEFVKKYKGKFILFFDDTIGSEVKQIEPEAYKLIEEGIKWLEIKPNKILYKSDRNEIYYKYADELISKGYMYACDCPQEEFQRLKEKGVECPCRNLPVKRNLEKWKEMFKKNSKEGGMVIRLKTSMQDPDPAFRDRVMFKISERTHPRTKNKYRVYPSMEFSWAIDDHLIGTTHILRGIEHQMSTRVQEFIRDIFKWKNPESIYNGLLQIEGIKISKSKGAKEVKSKAYIGWNDPRLWSLQSLNDRGISPKAIREFIINMGLNKSNATVPINVLYSIDKKFLTKVNRYTFIENPKKIKINGSPELKIKLPLDSENKKFREFKTSQEFFINQKDFDLMLNGNYRLNNLLNFKFIYLNKIEPPSFSYISTDVDKSLKAKVINWLPLEERNISVRILLPNGKYINGIGEQSLFNLKAGEIIQFEKLGFVKLKKKNTKTMEFWLAHE